MRLSHFWTRLANSVRSRWPRRLCHVMSRSSRHFSRTFAGSSRENHRGQRGKKQPIPAAWPILLWANREWALDSSNQREPILGALRLAPFSKPYWRQLALTDAGVHSTRSAPAQDAARSSPFARIMLAYIAMFSVLNKWHRNAIANGTESLRRKCLTERPKWSCESAPKPPFLIPRPASCSGPEQSQGARLFARRQRTLDGEDRRETMQRRGKGAGFVPIARLSSAAINGPAVNGAKRLRCFLRLHKSALSEGVGLSFSLQRNAGDFGSTRIM
jgi:hypothetical protein